MAHFPIGVMLDSFMKPIPEALSLAAQLRVQGIQVYATRGELSPESMNQAKRREFKQRVCDCGLEIRNVRARLIASRIILMTAYSSPEVHAEACRLQVDHYLTKPVALSDLRRLTAAALESYAT
jgi:CheY-like chemotaxis protein